MDDEKQADLSVPDVMQIMRISRSTAMRYLHAGKFEGAAKLHPCGAVCGDPNGCQQGAWVIPASAVRAVLEPAVKAG